MTEEEAEQKVKDYSHLIGERWKSISSGVTQKITELKTNNRWKRKDTWIVEVLFEPSIKNGIAILGGETLDDFLVDYQKLN